MQRAVIARNVGPDTRRHGGGHVAARLANPDNAAACRSRPRRTSFCSTPAPHHRQQAPSVTLLLSATAVGTSSTMLMLIVPVAVLPLASVT